jgi:hypothetical protein
VASLFLACFFQEPLSMSIDLDVVLTEPSCKPTDALRFLRNLSNSFYRQSATTEVRNIEDALRN